MSTFLALARQRFPGSTNQHPRTLRNLRICGLLWILWVLRCQWAVSGESPAALALAQADDAGVVAVGIRGLGATADHVAVEKALRRVPLVDRVSFWLEKGNTHVHLYTRGAVRVTALQSALRAAEKELRDSLRMEVKYELDEAALLVASGTTVTFTGGDAAAQALNVVVPAKLVETRDGRSEAWVAPGEKPVSVGAMRKAIEGAGEKLVEVAVPVRPAQKPRYVCPEKCSESNEPGICPKCARALEKSKDPPPAATAG